MPKISALPSTNVAASTSVFPIVTEPTTSSAATKAMALGDLFASMSSNIGTSASSGAVMIASTAASPAPIWLNPGSSGSKFTISSLGKPTWITDDWGISVSVGSSGSTVATDTAAWVEVGFDIGITEVKLVGDQSGDLVVDIYANGVSSTPSASAAKITASAPPTLTNAQRSSDSVLTGWTTTILAGQWLTFDVTASSTIQRGTLTMKGRKLEFA